LRAAAYAAVVGILLAALYDPVWTSAVHSGADFILVVLALLVLGSWRAPSWAVVLVTVALAAWVI
jgi:chromate transporter